MNTGHVIRLDAPGGALRLRLTLGLVEKLEDEGGSLLKTAELLVENELKITQVLPLLRLCYAEAGYDGAASALDAFLLGHAPAQILTRVLTAILFPLHEMGAVVQGEVEGPGAMPGEAPGLPVA